MPTASIKIAVSPYNGTNTDTGFWTPARDVGSAAHESSCPRPVFWRNSGHGQTSAPSRAWRIELPGSANPWEAELNALRRLPPDWDSYGAPAPNETALRSLAAVLRKLYEIDNGLKPSIVPSAEGGCAVCFVEDTKYADVECFNDGNILAVISSGADTPDVWPVRLDEIGQALQKIRAHLGV